MSEFQRAGVVGCGQMGAGIAEVCARAGMDVVVLEADEHRVDAGRSRISASLDRAVRAQKLGQDEADAALARLRFTVDETEMADREIVVEAIVEAVEEKLRVFEVLDKVVSDERAILASNTSSIPIMRLASSTSRPQQVLGIHFFNPVPVLDLVELVESIMTSPETLARAEDFAAVLGRHVIRSQDRAGFVVNALLIPYILSSVRMLESGFASREHIDQGMVRGCAHPMGPLALADLIGLDTVAAVADSLYEEFKEPLYAPPPLLSRMVEAGLLGRKAGRGFYEYGR